MTKGANVEQARLEGKPGSHLRLPGTVSLPGDRSEIPAGIGRTGVGEAGRIREVEELRAQLHFEAFAMLEVLEERAVQIAHAIAAQCVVEARPVPGYLVAGVGEGRNVEEIVNAAARNNLLNAVLTARVSGDVRPLTPVRYSPRRHSHIDG